MCGICGYLHTGDADRPVDEQLLRRMCAVMTHRGPDDQGIYTDGSFGMGMRRLSIIEGQVRGLRKMIENGTGCVEVLTQISAIHEALRGVGKVVVRHHIETCVTDAFAHGDDVDRPVMKAGGGWTYFAPDIAYHYDKVSRGFDQLIELLAAQTFDFHGAP